MNFFDTLARSVTLLIGVTIASAAPASAETVTRQILLPDGAPAKAVKVIIRASGDKPGAMTSIQGVTDDRGYFTKELNDSMLKTGSGSLVVVDSAKSALVISSIDFWTRQNGQMPQALRLDAADSGVKFLGEVVELSAAPVAGAKVSVLELTEGSMFCWHINSPSDRMMIPELTSQTQSNGSFSIRPFILESFSPLMSATIASTVTIKSKVFSGECATRVSRKQACDIKLFPTLQLSGVVLDADSNKPVPGAKVRVSELPMSMSAYGRQPSVCDAQGKFSINAVPAAEEITLYSAHNDYMDGETKVSSTKLSMEDPQSFQNLIIHATPLALVAGRVIDEATGKPPVAATKGSVEAYRMRIESEFSKQGSAEPNKTAADVQDNGAFSFKLPVGTNQLALLCSGYEWSSGKWKSEMKVPKQNQSDLVFKVREKIGTMVCFETKHPEKLEQYWLEQQDGKSWRREWIVPTPQFFGWNGSKWGDKVTIRVVRKDTGEIIVPQQDIVADPKHWLVSIPVP